MRISKTLKFSTTLTLFVILSAILAAAQQYQIQRADYGYRNQRVDVTQRLREVARSNSTFRISNSTLGTDPSPGHVKSLRIFARDSRGNERTFEYREGSTVDGSQFAGWGHGSWGGGGGGGGYGDAGGYAILHAEYGTARNHADVSSRLRELARSDRTFRVSNSTFGNDPDPGQVKALRIYARGPDGRSRMFEYREGSTVDGAQFTGWGQGNWGNEPWNGRWENDRDDRDDRYDRDRDSGGYAILHAEYGTARKHIDVTNRLRELARSDRTFRMGNSTFGIDPDPGQVKTLRIYSRGPDGRSRMFEYREGSTVDGAQFTGWGQGNWGNEPWNGRWENDRDDRDDRDRPR
jgi:hypothetical protein